MIKLVYHSCVALLISIPGNRRPHFGELLFEEGTHQLELRSKADEGETNENEKIKKIIDLKGNLNKLSILRNYLTSKSNCSSYLTRFFLSPPRPHGDFLSSFPFCFYFCFVVAVVVFFFSIYMDNAFLAYVIFRFCFYIDKLIIIGRTFSYKNLPSKQETNRVINIYNNAFYSTLRFVCLTKYIFKRNG